MKSKIPKLFFIISFIPYIILIFGIINSFINGFGSNPNYINTIFIPKEYGFNGVKLYLKYTFNYNLLGIIFIPLYGICILYQSFYIVKNTLNSNRREK